MSYSTTDEIVEEFKSIDIDESDSIITVAKVDRFRGEASGLINSYISNIYATPILIANLDAYNMLKKIEIDLVSFRIVKIMSIKEEVIGSNGLIQKILEGTFHREAMALLKKISEGTINLPGVDSKTLSAFGSYATKNNQIPVMKKDERQW